MDQETILISEVVVAHVQVMHLVVLLLLVRLVMSQGGELIVIDRDHVCP